MSRVGVPPLLGGFGLAVALFAVPCTAQLADASAVESAIGEVLVDWQVPGMAVAVVRHGEVVLATGLGVRKLGTSEPVTPHTLFSIGSCTKAFTAAAVGTLVEEERLGWDDPVVRHLDSFVMPDPADSGRVTVRDLLAHRTGLSGGDLISWGSTFSRREIVERIHALRQSSPLRTEYHYDNNTYVAAGEVAAEVAGTSWDRLVADRLLGPLGMDATVTSITSISADADRAAPHAPVDGSMRPIEPINEDNCAAAGAIWSSVLDMTHWVRMLLDRGAWGGRTVLQSSTVDEMFQMQIPYRQTDTDESRPPVARPTFEGYGLGWNLHDYRGLKVVSHGGQTDGMVAQVTLVPERGFGIVILLNRHESDAFKPVEHLLLDALIGADPAVDWSAVFRPPKADVPPQPSRFAATPAPLLESFDPYTGRYVSPVVGAATVSIEGGRLQLVLDRTPLYGGSLQHLHGDTFMVHRSYPLVDPSPVEFHADSEGAIVSFTLLPDDTEWLASMPYLFERDEPAGESPKSKVEGPKSSDQGQRQNPAAAAGVGVS